MIKFKVKSICRLPIDLNDPMSNSSDVITKPSNKVFEATEDLKQRLDIAVAKGILEYIVETIPEVEVKKSTKKSKK